MVDGKGESAYSQPEQLLCQDSVGLHIIRDDRYTLRVHPPVHPTHGRRGVHVHERYYTVSNRT